MIDVRADLIQKEFEKGCTQGLTFQRLKPSNSLTKDTIVKNNTVNRTKT